MRKAVPCGVGKMGKRIGALSENSGELQGDGFASGAVRAADWIVPQPPGICGMQDVPGTRKG